MVALDYVNVKPFWTVFVRPDRFRFEYRALLFPGTPEQRSVTWACGDDVRRWQDWGARQDRTGIRTIAGGGVGSAWRRFRRLSWVVPFLLLPEWGKGSPWHLSELTRIDDSHIEGVECYRVQGRFAVAPGHNEECQRMVRRDIDPNAEWNPQVSPITFWVEKSRMLLRRFENSGRVMWFRFETVAEYQPEIDVPVTERRTRVRRELMPESHSGGSRCSSFPEC